MKNKMEGYRIMKNDVEKYVIEKWMVREVLYDFRQVLEDFRKSFDGDEFRRMLNENFIINDDDEDILEEIGLRVNRKLERYVNELFDKYEEKPITEEYWGKWK